MKKIRRRVLAMLGAAMIAVSAVAPNNAAASETVSEASETIETAGETQVPTEANVDTEQAVPETTATEAVYQTGNTEESQKTETEKQTAGETVPKESETNPVAAEGIPAGETDTETENAAETAAEETTETEAETVKGTEEEIKEETEKQTEAAEEETSGQEETERHTAVNITNQAGQLKLNFGNAWYQDAAGGKTPLEELSGAVDYSAAGVLQTAGMDLMYRLNQEGEARTVQAGDWFEVTLPDVFTNLRLESSEAYGSDQAIEAADVQITGNTVKVTFKDAVNQRDWTGIHGLLHLAFEIQDEKMTETVTEYTAEIQEGNVYTFRLPARAAENEAADSSTEAIENVKSLFEEILKEYFAEALQYDLLSEEAGNIIRESVLAMDPETLEACAGQLTEAVNAFDALSAEDAVSFMETEAGLYQAIMTEVTEALTQMLSGGIAPMSLLPLEEIQAALVYNESIKTIDDLLANLQDQDGNKIQIAEDADTVWRYVKNETDGIESYEKYEIGSGQEIELFLDEDVSSYLLELIVGSGAQLDQGNIRYLVTVYLTQEVEERLSFEVYTEDENGVRSEVIPTAKQELYNDDFGTNFGVPLEPMKTVFYEVLGHTAESQYYLGISSLAAAHPERQVEVYTIFGYISYLQGQGIPITEQILNLDMTASGAGYKGNFSAPENIYDDFGLFFVVEKDLSGNEIRTTPIVFCIVPEFADMSYVNSKIFTKGNSGIEDVTCRKADSITFDELYINLSSGETDGKGIYEHFYMLKEGYSADSELYCAFDAHGNIYGDEANKYVTKAVVGLYDSLDEAADAEDIKEQLFPTDSSGDYGYKANYDTSKGGVYFTAFFDDGNIWRFHVKVMEYDPKYDENYVKQFTEAPVIGEADPWFRVTGAKDSNGEILPSYIVENGKNNNIDTAYGYGYQTVMINSTDTTIEPTFDCVDTDTVKITGIFLDGKPFETGQTIELDPNKAETQVIFNVEIMDENGEHTKNYPVSFVRKVSGPQLFVVEPKGDNIRSVFLTQYFESKHDILIANVGDAPLEDIRVELDAKHCKLDEYWTVGGDNNNILAPFDSVSSDSEYGELPNLAKIRLLPDGEGEVEGTLTIYAKDQEPIVIQLSGRAVNPEITTVELDDGVKWVPYSYMVTTNNMYDWNSLTFSLISGSLPNGMTLNEATGEIYGAPNTAGTYTFTIQADFSHEEFESSQKEFTITVLENEDATVFRSSDAGYSIIPDENGENGYVGEQVSAYEFMLTSLEEDELYISEGEYGEFAKLWLNGQALEEGTDYTTEAGSTRITIKSQTLKEKTIDGTNTISAEYNVDNKRGENLKRTSQNFRVEITPQETEKPAETEQPVQTEKPAETEQQPQSETTAQPVETEQTEQSERPAETNKETDKPSGIETPEETERTEETEKISETDGRTETEDSGETEESSEAGNVAETEESETAEETFGTITCSVYMVDGEDQPIADLLVELHSEPRSASTDSQGLATFSDVEFGRHTIYVKDGNGETIVSKDFEIQSGESLSLDGDIITAREGETITVKVRYEDGVLSLISVSEGTAVIPKTGDSTEIMPWFISAALALCVAAVCFRRKRAV